MIITLISISLFLLSLFTLLTLNGTIKIPKISKRYAKMRYNTKELLAFICVLFIIISALATVFCAGCILAKSIHYEENYLVRSSYYEELKTEIKNSNDASDIAKHQLNSEIREFNSEIRTKQYWSNNLWTNWFYEDFYSEFKPLKMQ